MIILDTNALIWWTTAPEKLSKKGRKAIENAISETEVLVCSISIWEVYLLIKNNRIRFTIDVDSWLEKVERLPSFRFVPVDNAVASKSVKLPDLKEDDPADRMIIAAALQYGATIITSDKKILNYSYVQSIW